MGTAPDDSSQTKLVICKKCGLKHDVPEEASGTLYCAGCGKSLGDANGGGELRVFLAVVACFAAIFIYVIVEKRFGFTGSIVSLMVIIGVVTVLWKVITGRDGLWGSSKKSDE